jgi:hypothetical protein
VTSSTTSRKLRIRKRALCHSLGTRVAATLLLWAIVLGGWLAGDEAASARGDSQQGVAVRAGYKASTTHRTEAGRRRRATHRAHVTQGRKAACRHGRKCAQLHQSPSQSGPEGNDPSGSAGPLPPAAGSPPSAGEPLSGGPLTEASPPAPAPPGGTSSKAPTAEEPPAQGPPREEPPAEEPPTIETPAKEPPAKEPPKEEPPAKEPPAKELPKEEPPSDPSYALRLFSAQSFFNQPLATSAPQASNSAQLVAAFNHQVQTHYGHVVVNTTEWSAPVYTVPANAPTTAVVPQNGTCPRGEGVFQPFAQDVSAVPIPAGAKAAKGTDEDMVVWQPSSGHEWELWRAQQEDGQWTACWGGEFQDAYTGEGVLPEPLGVSAAGLSVLAGQIHLEELQEGTIDHALEVTLPDTAAAGFVWPANRTDGTSDDAYSIPEGTRFRLKPSLNLSSLNLNPAALEIATAIQRYGMIVADTAGAVTLEAQDPTPLMRASQPNPYEKLLSGGPYEVLNAVPWTDLEVVSPSYHE